MKHIINEYGDERWYDDNGNYHREDGPALILKHQICWYQHGKLHRLDGPAVLRNINFTSYLLAIEAWYIDDERIFCKDNEEFLRIVKMKYLL
jgi:hypothetical protein